MKINGAAFWAKVRRGLKSECWPWLGSVHENRGGYGLFSIKAKWHYAHRIAWRVFKDRSIPKGKVIRHTCDNPICCNPHHLILGTHADNINDKFKKNRQARGESVSAAKLTENQVRDIFRDKRSNAAIAADYGVTGQNVGCIKRRRTWKHVTEKLVRAEGVEPSGSRF